MAGLLLAQAPDRGAEIRARMEAALARQQESVARQIAAARPTATRPESWLAAAPPPIAPLAAPEPACEILPRTVLQPLVSEAARQNGVTTQLVEAVIGKESAGKPCAVSRAGAMGLMQLMPATAQMLGVADPFDPKENVAAGTRYLRDLLSRYGGDLVRALGAYNAGPAAVDRYGGLPPYPETRDYVQDVLTRALLPLGIAGLP